MEEKRYSVIRGWNLKMLLSNCLARTDLCRPLSQFAIDEQYCASRSKPSTGGNSAAESELQMPSYPTRIAAVLALEEAIESYTLSGAYTGPGPGKWTVDSPGRFFIALTWAGQFKTNHNIDYLRVWKEFGGEVILALSGLQSCRVISAEAADGSHFSSGIILVHG